MKKLICLVLVFTVLLTACSGWEVEIRNPEEENEKTSSESKEEISSEPGNIPEEPKAESFDKIMVYSDDYNVIFEKLEGEILSEWLDIIKPEEWTEDSSEKEGGHLSSECLVLGSGMDATMYIGFDSYGDEIALIKWGGSALCSKSYLIPEGTFERAKAFAEEIKEERTSVFSYPECNFDMSAQAFLARENDEYILWLARFLDCLGWPVATGLGSFTDYKGFDYGGELNSKQLFNCFMFVFDENSGVSGSNRTELAWLDETDGKYHIPINDINSVLGKYFSGFSFDYTKIGVNYEYDWYNDGIIIQGGYGIGNQWYGKSKVVSVEETGDGALFAIIEIWPFSENEEGGFDISKENAVRKGLEFRPSESGCTVSTLFEIGNYFPKEVPKEMSEEHREIAAKYIAPIHDLAVNETWNDPSEISGKGYYFTFFSMEYNIIFGKGREAEHYGIESAENPYDKGEKIPPEEMEGVLARHFKGVFQSLRDEYYDSENKTYYAPEYIGFGEAVFPYVTEVTEDGNEMVILFDLVNESGNVFAKKELLIDISDPISWKYISCSER